MSRKRFTDYPTSFWFAVLATITAAILAISSYSRMINDDVATMKAAMIVISFEGALIVAMATMNGRLQGLLKGWAFVLLFLLAMAEIFMASMEIQHGIAEAGANAENYQQSANNLGTVAAGMADATKALADCDKRYPRKKKDADARAQCRKPYEKIVAASAGAMPSGGNNAPKYDEENAGKLSQWQAVADVLNTTWQPEKPITWGQAAFYVMTAIMALFIMVKNFLWAKYAHGDELTAYLANQQTVNVPEHVIGNPTPIHDQPESAREPHAAMQFVGREFARAQHARNNVYHKLNNKLAIQPVGEPANPLQSVNTACNTQTVGEPANPLQSVNTACNAADPHLQSVMQARVGERVNCPHCGTTFVKRNSRHLFCSNSRNKRTDGGNCSDQYHNERDPTRLEALKAIKRRKSA